MEIEITKGSVYNSLHDSRAAKEMATKAELVRKIIAIQKSRSLTQAQLGDIIGMNQADVSRMLKGNFRSVAVGKMLDCLTSLNQDIEIIVKPHAVEHEVGDIHVVAAIA
jgi:predicted XRE-type DNA-binding protein